MAKRNIRTFTDNDGKTKASYHKQGCLQRDIITSPYSTNKICGDCGNLIGEDKAKEYKEYKQKKIYVCATCCRYGEVESEGATCSKCKNKNT